MGTDAPTLRREIRLPPYRSPLEASAGLWRSKRLLPLGTIEGAGHEFPLDRALLDELARNFDAADAPLLLTLGRGNQPSWDPERQIGQVVDLVAMDDGLHAVLELSRAADDVFAGSPELGLAPLLLDDGPGRRRLGLVTLPTDPAGPPPLELASPERDVIDLSVDLAWTEALHPRAPKGAAGGGQFAALTGGVDQGASKAGQKIRPGGSNPTKPGQVRRLQRALGIRASGRMDPNTRQAVRTFQERYKLKVDGIAGRQTLGTLALLPHHRHQGRPTGLLNLTSPTEQEIHMDTTASPVCAFRVTTPQELNAERAGTRGDLDNPHEVIYRGGARQAAVSDRAPRIDTADALDAWEKTYPRLGDKGLTAGVRA